MEQIRTHRWIIIILALVTTLFIGIFVNFGQEIPHLLSVVNYFNKNIAVSYKGSRIEETLNWGVTQDPYASPKNKFISIAGITTNIYSNANKNFIRILTPQGIVEIFVGFGDKSGDQKVGTSKMINIDGTTVQLNGSSQWEVTNFKDLLKGKRMFIGKPIVVKLSVGENIFAQGDYYKSFESDCSDETCKLLIDDWKSNLKASYEIMNKLFNKQNFLYTRLVFPVSQIALP